MQLRRGRNSLKVLEDILEDEAITNSWNFASSKTMCVTLANIYILLKGFFSPFHSADALSVEVGGEGKVWANNSFPS